MKYLIFLLAVIACNVGPRKNLPVNSNEVLDTIKTAPSVAAKPALFETAFINGTTQEVNGATVQLYGVTIGKIKIGSGRIVACDPLHIDEYGIPFTQPFPTGEFPVQLSIVKVGNEETIAFMRVSFSDEPVARWEYALQKGQAPKPIQDEKEYGYGVDGGIGVLFDEEAKKSLNLDSLTNMGTELYREMNKHYHNGWKYTIYKAGDYNVAAFTTGFGDGNYATYIGYNAAGKPCRLTTDFGLFKWREK
jgi:hypothetical protein